ncbi:MAG: translation initiation factor IF-3 [bacterium]
MQEFRVNHKIRAREVMVIDPEGNCLGVITASEGLTRARQFGLDLVEVSPNAQPPVCKILDFGKFRYEIAKRDKDARKHNVGGRVKELKFHINIDEHDYLVKMRKAEDFMMKSMKVKIAMIFRGREMQRKELGRQLMDRIRGDLADVGSADAEPKLIGKHMNMMLTPHPAKKRMRKFTKEDEPEEEIEDAVATA